MSEHSIKIETASIEDLPQILELVMELFEMQGEFPSNETLQEQALRLIVESPNRGRIFVMRNEHCIIGIVTLLFTISTARILSKSRYSQISLVSRPKNFSKNKVSIIQT